MGLEPGLQLKSEGRVYGGGVRGYASLLKGGRDLGRCSRLD